MGDPDRSSPGKPKFGRTRVFSITRSKGCLDSADQRCCFLILMGIGQHHRPDELCSRVDAELAIHLREVDSTVAGLMKRRWAISVLRAPCAAIPATWASCGVRSSWVS